MMGLRKPPAHIKFEVAGFIYNRNLREFVAYLIFGKLTLPLDSQTQNFLFNVQVLWRYYYRKWVHDFYEQPRFTMKNFKVWEAAVRLKIYGPNKYQMAHPYAKTGRINRLEYVPVAVF